MRYYDFRINGSSELIKENAKINLRDYAYDSAIAAVNLYFYRTGVSNMQFFIYREESSFLRGVLNFYENKHSLEDVLSAIENGFEEVAGLKVVDMDPEEITTYQYVDRYIEARRRGYVHNYNYLNEANEFIYDAIRLSDNVSRFGLTLEEKIVTKDARSNNYMYDKSVVDEIKNIKNHKAKTNFNANIVHYIIASRSLDASVDMAESILQNLLKANRISSRRIEVVREIDPWMYKKCDYIERIIEGNFGGAIIIDMTEQLGEDPVNYHLNCQYIESMVKKHKNHCLFFFTYNMDKPGFAYTLLPMVQNHVNFVKLKEATGSRKEAALYMKELIKSSSYSEYANQAGEFLDSFKGNKFTQTEILEAYEKFEPWCMNRNFFGAYSYNPEEDFFIDRDEDLSTASDKLNKLIGLKKVKEQINKILVTDLVEKERRSRINKAYQASSMHMIFAGNPGTAKTTVAKLFAGIAKEKGIIKSGIFVERGGADYNGFLAHRKLQRDFEAAKGGVLFIDEAYEICAGNVIAALIKEMENRRDEVIVVLAGYNKRMQDFLSLNEGLKSRIPYLVDFPDYSTDELLSILQLMADERGFKLTDNAKKDASVIFDKVRFLDNFGNGRYVRNLIEKSIKNQSVRLAEKYSETKDIPKKTLFTLSGEDVRASEEVIDSAKKPGEAKKELDEMIGIADAKKMIHKAVATYKMKRRYVDSGLCKDAPTMHMVFTGNPGTAKTTTARLLAEILRDEKVLPSGKFTELGRADLIGKFVGETAPRVKKCFKDAQGGVLFIDEAYSLCDGYKNSFGDEAINTIVQEMENHREDTIVIFAGYPKEMEEFLERNPGMKSRIAFHVEFEDYSTDELCDIARLMAKKKSMNLTDEALNKLRDLCDAAKSNSDYGNGRFVRKVLEEAEMNLACRLFDCGKSENNVELMTTIEACDIESPKKKVDVGNHIGFRVA